MFRHDATPAIVFVVALVLAFVVPITVGAAMAPRRLKATMMDDRFITLSGVHPSAIHAWSAAAMQPMMPGAPVPQQPMYAQPQPYPPQYPPRY